jgi:hypothetical protein
MLHFKEVRINRMNLILSNFMLLCRLPIRVVIVDDIGPLHLECPRLEPQGDGEVARSFLYSGFSPALLMMVA